jgi:pimeloyl-ACP methyl ester carboxylesterase
MVDRLKYNVLPDIHHLTMPILLMVGDKDTTTPLSHHKILFEKLTGPKELHIIKGAPHSFKTENELKEIQTITEAWIEKYL